MICEFLAENRSRIYGIMLKALIPILIFLFCWIITDHFGFAINVSESLPEKYFLVHINKKPKVHDYLIFYAPKTDILKAHMILIKKVLGREGDVVTRINRDFFINGNWVGRAKTHSLGGAKLNLGSTGEITKGHYYVATKHEDSFDSRYEAFGWVPESHCIGVAYPIW